MTRGNQREVDRARAAARNAKKPQTKESGQDQLKKKMSDADKMREKQRRADLIKQGIDPDAKEEKPQKQFDQSYLKQYAFDYGEEEQAQ